MPTYVQVSKPFGNQAQPPASGEPNLSTVPCPFLLKTLGYWSCDYLRANECNLPEMGACAPQFVRLACVYIPLPQLSRKQRATSEVEKRKAEAEARKREAYQKSLKRNGQLATSSAPKSSETAF